ncbi:MAG: GIY-YIG nuclease family protein, partial [bacterium]|nr:GIY-YIG nuclease family protein [bacterium]
MSNILQKIKKLPNSPGVYFFLGLRKKILYIGRATSLKDRVKSYFNNHIVESRGPLIEKMLIETKDVDCVKTDSVLEAIILEAHLIKKHQPKYNAKEKSDKSFNYVVITDEEYPRVLLVRGKDLKAKSYQLKAQFGPFPQASVLREALKIIRKIFSFRDTCVPIQHSHILKNVRMLLRRGKKETRPCFNRQIGLCPGVCVGEISKEEYQKTIKNIILLFEGKKNILIKKLERDMNCAARKKEFEKAGKIKKTLFAL